MTEVNMKECAVHPVTYAQSLMDRAEAAEARAAALEAEVDKRRATDAAIRELVEAYPGDDTIMAVKRHTWRLDQARAERDRAEAERDIYMCERDELIEWRNTGAVEIETLTQERNEARRELEKYTQQHSMHDLDDAQAAFVTEFCYWQDGHAWSRDTTYDDGSFDERCYFCRATRTRTIAGRIVTP